MKLHEVENKTTGVSPFQLVFERKGRGPLGVLKSTWAKDVEDNRGLKNKSEIEYVEKLKENLQMAAEIADEHSKQVQNKYVDLYNQDAVEKSFKVDDLVLVSLPSSTNKLLSHWQGPTKIIKQVSENSYCIEMENGGRRVYIAIN